MPAKATAAGTLAVVKTFTIDLDGPVHAADHGGAGPPVVLVHGLGGSHHNWLALAPLLGHLGRVYALDLSGFGRTPPAGRGVTVDANRRLVTAFIAHLDQGPAAVIGNSMGGLIALHVAAQSPAAVSHLGLISPASPSWEPRHVDARWLGFAAMYLTPGIGRLALRAYERSFTPEARVAESFRIVAADPTALEPVLAAHVEMARERRTMPWALDAVLAAYRSTVRNLLPDRFDPVAASVEAPTLLIHGRRDRVVPFKSALRLMEHRPDWRFLPVDGVGHVAQLEAPKLVAEAITGLLDG